MYALESWEWGKNTSVVVVGGVFLRGARLYLRKFWRKPRKTLQSQVDKHNLDLNPASLVYQFWRQNLLATGGASNLRLILELERKLENSVKISCPVCYWNMYIDSKIWIKSQFWQIQAFFFWVQFHELIFRSIQPSKS